MSATVKRQSRYELFVTTEQHRILVLGGSEYYAWIEGDRGELLVRSDADHKEDHVLQKGRFLLVDFEDDPQHRDLPHLFLEQDGQYRAFILPNGLPTDDDYQKKLVATNEQVEKRALEEYLQHPDTGRTPDLPIQRYDALTVDELENALGEQDLTSDDLAKLKRYEEQHQNRKTALAAIDRKREEKL